MFREESLDMRLKIYQKVQGCVRKINTIDSIDNWRNNALTDRQELTGYPSKDRPWLKYYDKRPEDLVYPDKTLWQFVWDNNKNHMDDVVLQYFGKRITYRMFFTNVEKAAKSLNAMGVKKGDMVTIMSMHTPETIYVLYALNYVGAVANLVYPSLSAKELQDTIEKTESKILFILDAVIAKKTSLISKLKLPVIILSVDAAMPMLMKLGYRVKNRTVKDKKVISYQKFLDKGNRTEILKAFSDSKALAVIVYTSGTTGEPKGVCLSSDCIHAMVLQDSNGNIEFVRGKTCLFILPPFIGFGVTHIHMLVGMGIVSILQIVLEPVKIIDNLFKYNPYVFLTGPALTPTFLEHSIGNLKNMKYFIGGGGAISEQQIKDINGKLHACGSEAQYSNGYGMTELASSICVSTNDISKINSVGIPLIDTIVKVVDVNSGEECKYGEVGELWFHTASIMMGYYKNEKATKEVVAVDEDDNRWFCTGDLGSVDEDGFVFIKGRIKRIYITRGKDNMAYKLFPQRIEEVINSIEEVEQCAVIVKEHEEKMNVAIAVVSLKNSEKSEKEILERIKEHAQLELPDHMIPVKYQIIDKVPITQSGKIDYRKLEELLDNKGELKSNV